MARDIDAGADLPPDEVLTRTLPKQALQTGRAVVLSGGEDDRQSSSITEQALEFVVTWLPSASSPDTRAEMPLAITCLTAVLPRRRTFPAWGSSRRSGA